MKLTTQTQTYTLEIPVPKGQYGAYVTMTTMSASEVIDLLKKHKKSRLVEGKLVEEFDDLAIRKERFQRLVTGWDGLQDERGKDLICDDNTKAALCEFSPEFITLVFELYDQAQEQRRQELEQVKKN